MADDFAGRVGAAARRRVLDASLDLQARRRSAIAATENGRPLRDVQVVASGADVVGWTLQASRSWRRLLSTRTAATLRSLRRSMPNNRYCIEHGLHMVSVFDHESAEAAARTVLETEHGGPYFYAYAPVEMKLVDEREVLLHGAVAERGGSILSFTSREAVAAAWAYWHAVMATSMPCAATTADHPALTPRQHQVLELLRHEMSDERIAETLDISVRTVRYDIARAMETLDAHSRFAAGFAYAARLGG